MGPRGRQRGLVLGSIAGSSRARRPEMAEPGVTRQGCQIPTGVLSLKQASNSGSGRGTFSEAEIITSMEAARSGCCPMARSLPPVRRCCSPSGSASRGSRRPPAADRSGTGDGSHPGSPPPCCLSSPRRARRRPLGPRQEPARPMPPGTAGSTSGTEGRSQGVEGRRSRESSRRCAARPSAYRPEPLPAANSTHVGATRLAVVSHTANVEAHDPHEVRLALVRRGRQVADALAAGTRRPEARVDARRV